MSFVGGLTARPLRQGFPAIIDGLDSGRRADARVTAPPLGVWLGVDDLGVVVDGVVVEGVVAGVVLLLVADAVVVGLAGVGLWTAAIAAPLPAAGASATVANRMVCLGLRMSPPSRVVSGYTCIEAAAAYTVVSQGWDSDKTRSPGDEGSSAFGRRGVTSTSLSL
jgi:hypothetical protein